MSYIKSTKIKLVKFTYISLYFSSLLACADLNNVLEVEQIDPRLKVVSYSDDLQNTFVKKGANGTKICSQPDPDSAQAYADGLSVAVGAGPGEGMGDSSSATSLGGRNPEVLLSREMMYRACELSLNYDASYDQARSIYTEFLTAIVALGKTQVGKGSASVAGPVTNIENKASNNDDDDDEYTTGSK